MAEYYKPSSDQLAMEAHHAANADIHTVVSGWMNDLGAKAAADGAIKASTGLHALGRAHGEEASRSRRKATDPGRVAKFKPSGSNDEAPFHQNRKMN